MVPETHIHRSSTVNVGQNDEKLRGLLKTTEYCCILSLCEACWGLSHAARQMEKPQLTIVLFLMFVRKKEKNGMCVREGGGCVCVYLNFITRQKLQKLPKLKIRRKRKATSHLQSFYAMNRKRRRLKKKMGGKVTASSALFWHSV